MVVHNKIIKLIRYTSNANLNSWHIDQTFIFDYFCGKSNFMQDKKNFILKSKTSNLCPIPKLENYLITMARVCFRFLLY